MLSWQYKNTAINRCLFVACLDCGGRVGLFGKAVSSRLIVGMSVTGFDPKRTLMWDQFTLPTLIFYGADALR